MSDFTIQQGTSSGFAWPIYNLKTGLPIDLHNYTIQAQLRALSTDVLLWTWSTEIGNVLQAYDANHDCSVIGLRWTASETLNWRWKQGRYDLEITSPSGDVARIQKGIIKLSREVTQ